MARVFGLVVTKNECDRYLQACLKWHLPLVNALLVYDDGSDDDTLKVVADSGGAHYTCRPDGVPSFMEHEGRFRQDSLHALEELFQPVEGDWIIVIDTDEFLVIDGGDWRTLHNVAASADRAGCKSVRIPRPEIWDLNPPSERIDGFWGNIQCTRLFRWEPGGVIKDVAMGCGNEPTYVNSAKVYTKSRSLHLLHVGYVEEEDRKDKYDRYSSLSDHGHNDRHIQSILAVPTLRRWTGEMPDIWRGVR